MADRIRVLVVEDQDLLRDALVAALEIESDIQVVAAHADLAGARAGLDAGGEPIDVAIVDFRLPDGNGTDLATGGRRLLITGTNEEIAVRAALEAGFEGFVAKGSGLGELAQAVRVVHAGGAIFPAGLLPALSAVDTPDEPLTDREMDVLADLAEACSPATIAARRHLSIHTVRNHIRSILTKLGAHSQLEAVVIAARSGLVDL
ncbi:MAG: response regulator transcription factor [Actinomycetota bacterium]